MDDDDSPMSAVQMKHLNILSMEACDTTIGFGDDATQETNLLQAKWTDPDKISWGGRRRMGPRCHKFSEQSEHRHRRYLSRTKMAQPFKEQCSLAA